LVLFTYMQKDMQGKLLNNHIRPIIILIGLLSGIFNINGQPTDENYLSGCALFKKGQNSKALERLALAISRNNADENLFIKRGEVLLASGDIENAIKDFDEANIIYPGVADLWLARAYSLSGETDKAISCLKSHLESDLRLPGDSIKKDPAFDNIQTTAAWEALWNREWYSDEEKAVAEADYYNRKQLYDEAIAILNKEIAGNPSSKLLLSSRGKVYFNQGNYAAAIADYTAALNLEKKDANQKRNRSFFLTPEGVGGGYPSRGLAYLKAERYKDATNDFTRAIKDHPENFQLYLLRAESYAGQNDWQSAIKDIQFYLKYFEDDQHALYLCGKLYYGSEDYINALKYFNRNLKDDPNNSLYYKARGMTYLKTSTYRYAINDLSMSLDLNPDDAETWMYLGVAKIQSGDEENGCSDLKRSQQMGNAEAVRYMVEDCR
jgi:tetratricopeptide (TPR) repeat protein